MSTQAAAAPGPDDEQRRDAIAPEGGPPVKEKELRFALVCYGGVSLAVYEHGITKEILNLVRASQAYHSAVDAATKQREEYTFEAIRADGEAHSTEEAYFDALKVIGAGRLDLRVIVDVIAGASAGGVNGVVLARALAHDLSLEPITHLWLNEADIEHLMAPEVKAHAWDKWYVRPFVRPFLWGLERTHVLQSAPDLETRAKLSMFLRSRWFRPPLDGRRLSTLFLDALEAMGEPRAATMSLLPSGQQLDLLVTVTDFHGSARTIYLHDPPLVREREHRHVLRFGFRHAQGVGVHSDFDLDNLPSLAFAARATSSYPGAFPPAQIREMDDVLAARHQAWAQRRRFVEVNFRHYRELGLAPEDAVLVDGGVLDNKPIRIAVEAVRTHAAFREVDRRLLYIDPNPQRSASRQPGQVPSFLGTFRGALSDLPRYEPINDELAWIERINEEVRRLQSAVEATRPNVVAVVERAAEGRLDEPATSEQVRRWRLESARLLGEEARIPYNHFIRLMIGEGTAVIARLVCEVCGHAPHSPRARWIATVLDGWAHRNGIYPLNYGISAGVASEADLNAPMKFIVDFDLAYRYRRLYFVIRTVNRLYPRIGQQQVSPGTLDLLKRRLYRCLDSLRVYERPDFLSADCVARMRLLFGQLPESADGGVTLDAQAFHARNEQAIDALIVQINQECDLVRLNEEADAVLASPAMHALGTEYRREVLVSYLGYLFWDIILLPMLREHAPQGYVERQEIMVDRISPEDAASLRLEGLGAPLKGGEFGGFGGFFSRVARENDYLWGRLHAVDRLFDVLASSAQRDIPGGIDTRALKKRAFRIVLDEESKRLSAVPDLLARLEAAVERL